MSTINFPSSPVLNEQYTYNNRVWFWDGSGWERAIAGGAFKGAFTEVDGPWITAFVLKLTIDATGTDPTTPFTLLTHI